LPWVRLREAIERIDNVNLSTLKARPFQPPITRKKRRRIDPILTVRDSERGIVYCDLEFILTRKSCKFRIESITLHSSIV